MVLFSEPKHARFDSLNVYSYVPQNTYIFNNSYHDSNLKRNPNLMWKSRHRL